MIFLSAVVIPGSGGGGGCKLSLEAVEDEKEKMQDVAVKGLAAAKEISADASYSSISFRPERHFPMKWGAKKKKQSAKWLLLFCPGKILNSAPHRRLPQGGDAAADGATWQEQIWLVCLNAIRRRLVQPPPGFVLGSLPDGM